MMLLLSLLIGARSAPPDTAFPDSVVFVFDAMDAAMGILERRARGEAIPAVAWDSMFAAEGYRRLKDRELSLKRPFSDSAFRVFLLSDTLLARLPALRPAATAWRTVDLSDAVSRARAYLPPGTPIRARLYPLIKPATNSFVHLGPDGVIGIFMYVEPAQPVGEARTTLAHELHHVGYSAACPEVGVSRASPAERALLQRLGAFGEGVAMLAAAGSPDVNPNAESRPEMRADWDQGIAGVDGDFARIDSLIVAVATGRVTSPDSVASRAEDLYGAQGPWYTVGWLMSSTVERAVGRDRLIQVMCDPRHLILQYMTSPPTAEKRPNWSKTALNWLANVGR